MLHYVVSITILCNDLADGVEASAELGQEQGNSMVLAAFDGDLYIWLKVGL